MRHLPGEILERPLPREVDPLTERSIQRRNKEPKLPELKLLAHSDFVFQTGVDKRQIMGLARLDFAGRKQEVILASNSGTGGVGCQKNLSCRYTTATAMLQELLSGLADQNLDAKHKRYLARGAPDRRVGLRPVAAA